MNDKKQPASDDHRKTTRHRYQEYGNDPIAVRKTDHYQHEYVESFVDKWDELVDWEGRAESEGQFFIDILKSRGKQRVLDAATGTGFHSVQLIKAGFDVTSCDGSVEMLNKAFENGRTRGYMMQTVQADWRWLNRDIHGKFDAVVCLGNSFTHLFEERDRRRTLAEFYAALKHDGILILDHRNYDGILDAGFSSKHKYYYTGKEVTAEPEHVDEGLARFRYEFPDGSVFNLNMFPLRREYVTSLMHDTGFQNITTYGDFDEDFDPNEPDFFVHVAEKEYVE